MDSAKIAGYVSLLCVEVHRPNCSSRKYSMVAFTL